MVRRVRRHPGTKREGAWWVVVLVATTSFCFLLESAYLMRLNLDKQVYFGGDEGFLRRLEAPQGGKRAGGVGGSRCHRRPQGESTTRRCTTPRRRTTTGG